MRQPQLGDGFRETYLYLVTTSYYFNNYNSLSPSFSPLPIPCFIHLFIHPFNHCCIAALSHLNGGRTRVYIRWYQPDSR